jgi:hypothetical protein
MRRTILFATLLGTALAGGPARADDVADAIGTAQRAWQGGQVREARTALQEALQLLAQRAAADLAEALPDPLPGWTAQEARSNAAGAGGLLGGATASRSYRNAERRSVRIQVMTDNPMVTPLAALMANPMLAGAMGSLVRVGEHRAIQSSDGDVQMLVDNRILVTVQGNADAEAKLAYARAIDIDRLTGR